MTTEGFVNAISELANAASEGEIVEPGNIYVFRTLGGGVQQIDLTGDRYLNAPRRKQGTVVVRDAASFLAYWRKHSDGGSEVYADRSKLNIVAVLDAHETDQPRFGDHKLVLQLRYSDAFNAWLTRSGRWHNQIEFAEFIEDRRMDVREPVAAELLELAQTFQATKQASFKSSNRLKDGQRQLEYTEQINATAGHNSQMTIPDMFVLGLPVFDGDREPYRVEARPRYRIEQSGLRLAFIVDQANEIVNSAFEGVIADLVRGGSLPDADEEAPQPLGVPVLRGTPA